MKAKLRWRDASRLLAGLALASTVVSVAVLSLTSGAGADTTTTGFYLDLGASASVGFQPTYEVPTGQPTSSGYANDVVSYEAARGVTLSLTELGCPGETTTTMISGQDHCYHDGGSQLADAVTFLKAHDDEAGIVTVDLGFNDLRHCLHAGPNRQSCIASKIEQIQSQLPYILTSLQQAAGPDVSIIGVGHYDPYLADAYNGEQGERFALHSESMVDNLNDALSSVYSAANIPMATVSRYFDAYSRARVDAGAAGNVASDAAQACALTWMCAPKPYGPNIHPNDTGYSMIAAAIESQLKSPW